MTKYDIIFGHLLSTASLHTFHLVGVITYHPCTISRELRKGSPRGCSTMIRDKRALKFTILRAKI
jgi:hypothetical protein